ncbi:DUF2306 domain-containing protein [Alkalihalobacillus trypoxylicola]|uniref:DUF2306 domain-containing protein n=1 Tax=Alkalihalobacillus trypoxylicola TaxID=519424 RepID=A0A162F3H9_9BACI|nr:DUF2306 domain-containing protein [Alkalihalobacillus trypoxylicola]KYG34413.1 hypothetical protein AZF04_14610 [Alkalihalobacillus trypoxylicola]
MNRKTIIITLTVISLMWILHTASKNFIVDPEFTTFLGNKDTTLANVNLWKVMIQIHIVLAIVALITGPLGLSKRVRNKVPYVHRWNGRIYILSILLNMIPGYYVSFFANGGFLSIIGFLILNTLWLVTTISGYLFIKKKQISHHRKWMLRSFMITFANLTIYVVVAIFHNALGFDYGDAYTLAVWSSFTINLVIAEIIIRKTKI